MGMSFTEEVRCCSKTWENNVALVSADYLTLSSVPYLFKCQTMRRRPLYMGGVLYTDLSSAERTVPYLFKCQTMRRRPRYMGGVLFTDLSSAECTHVCNTTIYGQRHDILRPTLETYKLGSRDHACICM